LADQHAAYFGYLPPKLLRPSSLQIVPVHVAVNDHIKANVHVKSTTPCGARHFVHQCLAKFLPSGIS
jgi:hypothetical protein